MEGQVRSDRGWPDSEEGQIQQRLARSDRGAGGVEWKKKYDKKKEQENKKVSL